LNLGIIIAMPIKSFKCRDTEKLFSGRRVARFVHIELVARVSGAYALMISGEFVSASLMAMLQMLKLWTTTKGEDDA